MKNWIKLLGIIAVIVLLFSVAACDNGTTSNSGGSMDEILRVDKEVRDLFFYSSNGVTQDFSGDTGSYPGVCTDYAMEFYYRYSGEVYLVTMGNDWVTGWHTVVEWLPADTFNWRTKENFGGNVSYPSGNIGEYNGVLRDARITAVSNEKWTEQSHANNPNAVYHMWCAAVADGKWYLVDPTWRDTNLENNPIVQITTPSFAR